MASLMSPEQVRAEDVDARTDLFSFGVVLYEMATGQTPFQGASTGLIFDAILNRSAASATKLNPALPSELERIIGKCLEKDRALRYQHAGAVDQMMKHIATADGLPSIAAFVDVVELFDLDGRHVAILIEIDLRARNLAPPVR